MTSMQAQPEEAADEIRQTVDRCLSAFLEERGLPTNLDGAVRYALLGPGKRARPQLTIACCKALGGTEEAALPGACAVEMIHAFSLVHDDLPALDNDELRRGRPTAHIAFGEPMALLAGDALMSLAFEMAQRGTAPDRCVRELSTACTDMIAGQVLDTLGGDGDAGWERASPLERLKRVHTGKTGALIRASCRIGAICAGAEDDSEELRAITDYAEAIGLMFQIVDDLLDEEQSPEHVGKATGKDREAGKLTYPGVLGIEPARAEVRHLQEQASAALSRLGNEAGPLREICNALAIRTK
ncbi:MAG: polyprenyl synthetase family protein [Phycisphaerales bacterium JB065]